MTPRPGTACRPVRFPARGACVSEFFTPERGIAARAARAPGNGLIALGISFHGSELASECPVTAAKSVPMRNKNRAFSGFVLAGACLLAGPAHAVTVVPNVTTANPSASSSGQVPDPDPNNFLGVLFYFDPDPSDPVPPSAGGSVSSVPSGGAETSIGSAAASVDAVDFFGGSTYGARSEVFTDDTATPTGPTGFLDVQFNMNNQSLAAVDAVLDTTGLVGPGEVASVDAVLNLSGFLTYEDPTGAASATEVDDGLGNIIDIVPDMETSVSILFLLADDVDIGNVDPANPPAAALYSGSATLESVLGGGTPALSVEGDLLLSDFIQVGACDAFFCQYAIAISVPFVDVPNLALGFGDSFGAGLILNTSVEGVSDNDGVDGRRLVSDFSQTASFSVALNVSAAGTPLPAPATAGVLGLGLVILGALGRRARRDPATATPRV